MGSNVDSSAKAAANTIVDRRIILPIDPSRSTWSLESRNVSEFQQRSLHHESERHQYCVSEAVVWLTVRMRYKRVNLTKPNCKDRLQVYDKSQPDSLRNERYPMHQVASSHEKGERLTTSKLGMKRYQIFERSVRDRRSARNAAGKPRSRVMRTLSVQGL